MLLMLASEPVYNSFMYILNYTNYTDAIFCVFPLAILPGQIENQVALSISSTLEKSTFLVDSV